VSETSSPPSVSETRPSAETSPAAVEHVRRREWAVALRNGAKMGGSLLITWSVALIVKLRVPALLGPVRLGHFGFADSFAGMFFAVLGLGVDVHIMKEVAVKPKYASDVVGGVLVLRVLMSLLIFPVMALVLWRTGRSGEILVAVLVFGVGYVLTNVSSTLGAVLQANSRVGPAVVANIVTKIAWGGGLLIALHYNASLAFLALPFLVGEALRVAILMLSAKAVTGLEFRIDVKALREALVERVPYFINGLALGIQGNLVMSVLEFVRRDEREVGWFNAVQNLASLCMLLSPLLFWVVMPLLARAQARSEEEGMMVFRRCLEALVVAIAPITVLISAGADFLIHIVFRDKFAPAATGLSILSLVFVMTYSNMMVATHLTVLKKGWSVTVISISSIFVTSLMMLIFVPLGRRLLGEGGECAGAASAVIGSEAVTLVAMLTRYPRVPLDKRNIRVFAKTAAVAAVTLLLNHQLRFLGPILRLVIDAFVYAGLALALGLVRIQDIQFALRLIRRRGGNEANAATAIAEG
jgi:O-antigen/teichoic acid export membrane protein